MQNQTSQDHKESVVSNQVAGIHGSLFLGASQESLNKELIKMGINGEASLLYRGSRDGFRSETLWDKCQSQKETITLVKTDLNSVIGCYCPDQWEDTSGMESTSGSVSWKDIVSGKPFLFYFLADQIEIIKHRDDRIPIIRSNKY